MSKKIVVVNASPRKGWNTDTLVSGDTLQLKDYGKTDWPWTMFSPEAKQKRHETVFPKECLRAFEMGKALAEK